MEEKLVTLAILTYSKAQILKNVLENEGIEACIHNVNLIQPIISSGVRIRIRESDLPRALKIIESSAWLAEDVVNEEKTEEKHGKQVLIPVDFSDYSMAACEFGFNFAAKIQAEVVLMHVYFSRYTCRVCSMRQKTTGCRWNMNWASRACLIVSMNNLTI